MDTQTADMTPEPAAELSHCPNCTENALCEDCEAIFETQNPADRDDDPNGEYDDPRYGGF